MKNLTRKSESGQAIVLLVLLLVGMIGIVGLAIDGGNVFQERRRSQNAADNAALAGALALCEGDNPLTAAFASTFNNGFDNDQVTNFVTVNNPPSQGPNSGDSEFVEVSIRSIQGASFSSLVFSGVLESTSRAVGHCQATTGSGIGDGNGLIALEDDKDKAIRSTSSGLIKVNGGGIFSNSSASNGLFVSGSGDIEADTTIEVVGNYESSGSGAFNPTPIAGVPAITDPLAEVPEPTKPGGACIDFNHGSNSNVTINPGKYCKITVTSNGNVTMNPGVYYVEQEVAVTGGGDLSGSGVMIYMESKEIKLTGNGDLNISAPTSGTYAGMVIFMGRANNTSIELTGYGGLISTGTIYGPAATFKITGSGSSNSINSQVIVSEVENTGNGSLIVNYDAAENYGGGAGSSVINLAE
ncbi:MAG: hypothetical protein DWG76_00630 [Chloroflexi bacterium]|nr:pilus assembly protein TadG-related protein [Chloroflexota bacterium]MQC25943.1 hypothetical protein [Chloroflexota bacterium]